MYILRFWLTQWLVLCFITLPFSYHFLPRFGSWVSMQLTPLSQPLSLTLFGIDTTNTFAVSDSAALYSVALIFALFSVVFTIIIHRFFRNYFAPFENLLFYMLLYILVFFLLRYGLDKWIGNQFYTPASNTLYTPLGQLSKDILFWSSMGTSHQYNLFMAGSEMLAAILLVLRRTRFLGLLISFGVLLNVFAINIGFDITVKYVSGLLVLATSVLIFYFPQQVASFFRKDQSICAVNRYFSHSRTSILVKSFVLVLLLTELLFAIGSSPDRRDSGTCYSVIGYNGNSTIISLAGLRRIHIHPEGYLITESNEQHFESHRLIRFNNQYSLNGRTVHFTANKLIWTERDTVVVQVRKIDLETLPAKQDEMHWFVEELMHP